MREKKRQKIEYLMMYPVFIMIGVLTCLFLCRAGTKYADIVFFLCYFSINLFLTLIFVLRNMRKWDIVASFAVILLMSIIFRDLVLTFNMLYAFGVTIVIYALRLEKARRIGLPIVTALLIITWLFFFPYMPKGVAICLVVLILYSIAALLEKNTVYYIAIPLAIALITIWAPVKDEPFQWTFVKRGVEKANHLFKNVSDEVIYLFGSVGFDGGHTGYSNSGRIAGGLTDFKTEELKYEHNGRKSIIYLKGKSYITLDNKGFTDPDTDTHLNDWFALYINALKRHDINRREASFFSKIITADVRYRFLKTTDTIMPATPLYIEYEGNDIPKYKKKNFRYQVRYLMLDYGSPFYLDIINDPLGNAESFEPADYKTIVSYTKELYSIDLKLIMSEEEYNEAVKPRDLSAYLDTSMATDSIRNLTEELTSGLENDFEKARAIEAYLRPYEYNKAIDLSDSENYIEDFLFETKTGYCVHYASSMVLMLRIAGIPARYSVGYRHDENKTDSIISSEAHSWPEAYIEGYGWVPFEPTGAMETPEEYTWGLGSDYNREDYLNGREDDGRKISSAAVNDEDYYNRRYITDIPETEITEHERKIDKKFVLKFMGYMGMLLGALILVLLTIIIIRHIRYTLMTPEYRLRENMLRIMDRVDDPEVLEDGAKKEELRALLDTYMRVRFRGDPADEDMVLKARTMYRYIRKTIKASHA